MVLNNYYSFNLCKDGGKIRLIISINEIEQEQIQELKELKKELTESNNIENVNKTK